MKLLWGNFLGTRGQGDISELIDLVTEQDVMGKSSILSTLHGLNRL